MQHGGTSKPLTLNQEKRPNLKKIKQIWGHVDVCGNKHPSSHGNEEIYEEIKEIISAWVSMEAI